MLVKLLGYEFYKKWRVSKNILGGFIVLQVLLLTITRIFLGHDATKMVTEIGNINNGPNGSFTFGIITLLYFGIAVGIFFLPLIENVYRFEKDLSGKQAVLELMIPIIAWKKILSKLIVMLISTIAIQMISALSIMAYILVNSNFNKVIVDSILNNARIIISSPGKSFFVALYAIYILALIYILVMFCIAFSKSITHKNRIAVPIGMGMFIACMAVFIVAATQIVKFPIVEFDLFGIEESLSGLLFVLLYGGSLFLGASFLMEKRIEN